MRPVLEEEMRVFRVRFYSYDHKFFREVAGDARVGEGVRRGEREGELQEVVEESVRKTLSPCVV